MLSWQPFFKRYSMRFLHFWSFRIIYDSFSFLFPNAFAFFLLGKLDSSRVIFKSNLSLSSSLSNIHYFSFSAQFGPKTICGWFWTIHLLKVHLSLKRKNHPHFPHLYLFSVWASWSWLFSFEHLEHTPFSVSSNKRSICSMPSQLLLYLTKASMSFFNSVSNPLSFLNR